MLSDLQSWAECLVLVFRRLGLFGTNQTEAHMAHDIRMLEEKIKRLTQSISELAQLPPGFGPIIHKPGFTSIAEWQLILAGIDNQ